MQISEGLRIQEILHSIVELGVMLTFGRHVTLWQNKSLIIISPSLIITSYFESTHATVVNCKQNENSTECHINLNEQYLQAKVFHQWHC